ncbi:MAG: hypothetical protein DRO99_02975 [Candidatus Aenigmatarchaeota archaeon]|nr:MAG: hypothetical protein DRO99_02975 [Candidatus Aenigmarchaeota archaeon]
MRAAYAIFAMTAFAALLAFQYPVVAIPPPGIFAGGSGTLEDPYQIETCVQLQNMSTDLTAYYALNNDIHCSMTSKWNDGEGFSPVGVFEGGLDGRNHTIWDLNIHNVSNNYVGLFGKITGSATVKNLILRNVNITGSMNVGGVSGYIIDAMIYNCHVTGNVKSGSLYAGGLVGKSVDLDVRDSSSMADIECGGNCGGIVGGVTGGQILNSYYSGNLLSSGNYLGGIAGWIDSGTLIQDSYARGSITGNNNIGGIVGNHNEGSDNIIENCFSSMLITGNSKLGGIVGFNDGAIITNSYWNNVTGNPGYCVGDPQSNENCTAVQDNESWFFSASNEPMASWDFDSEWVTRDGDYPVLSGQNTLDNCTELWIPDTTYVLHNNITSIPASVCLNVTADNVTIDLNGHTIANGTDVGIYLGYVKRAKVINGTISGFGYGVYAYKSNRTVIDDVTFTDNLDAGVYAYKSERNEITNVVGRDNERVLYFSGSHHNIIRDFNASNSYRHIYFSGSSNNTLSYISTMTNTYYGSVYNLFNSTLKHSRLYNCTDDCVAMPYFSYIENVTMTGTDSARDSLVYDASYSVFRDIRAVNWGEGGAMGVYANNLVIDSRFESSAEEDIISYGENNTLLNCTYDTESVYYYDDDGDLIRKWYLNVLVEDDMGRPVQNAIVTLYNGFGDLYDTSNTNVAGETKRFEVIEYVNVYDSGVTSHNDYTIKVNHTTPMLGAKTKTVTIDANSFEKLTTEAGMHTMQIRLNINSTGENIYVPGEGSVSVFDMRSYNPPKWYASSDKGGRVASLVLAHQSPYDIRIGNTSDSWCYGADTNKDGFVGQADLNIVLSHFGESGCSASNSWCSGADTDNDGAVDDFDLSVVLDKMGDNCSMNGRSMTLSQTLRNSKALLVFTGGDRGTIEEKAQSVESGSFLQLPSPSFAYGRGTESVVKFLVGYHDVDIANDLILQQGKHTLEFRNNGLSNGSIEIAVRSV